MLEQDLLGFGHEGLTFGFVFYGELAFPRVKQAHDEGRLLLRRGFCFQVLGCL